MLSLVRHHKPLACGLDEAGRGCLAGPVFAAAVILDPDRIPEGLNDSKKLSAPTRKKLRLQIEESALCWSVSSVDATGIDQINILRASIKAMHQAIDSLSLLPNILLVDGNHFDPFSGIPHQTIIKGDGKYYCIAAASILAKTHRDEYMELIHKRYPQYGWDRNKGYPTAIHIKALMAHGPSPFHRKSFTVKNQISLEL